MSHPDRDLDLLRRSYKERDEHGRLPHHWLAEKAQTHTHALATVLVVVQAICWNKEALITRDKEGETPLDIARRSGACAEIIGLLSLTPEKARSFGSKGMCCLYGTNPNSNPNPNPAPFVDMAYEALITRDSDGETPLDVARRSRVSAEIEKKKSKPKAKPSNNGNSNNGNSNNSNSNCDDDDDDDIVFMFGDDSVEEEQVEEEEQGGEIEFDDDSDSDDNDNEIIEIVTPCNIPMSRPKRTQAAAFKCKICGESGMSGAIMHISPTEQGNSRQKPTQMLCTSCKVDKKIVEADGWMDISPTDYVGWGELKL